MGIVYLRAIAAPRDPVGDRGNPLQILRNAPSISFGNPDKMGF
ncbi:MULTISPECIES: hypothetical protein [Cyanophyceae]|nr:MULTISPECIES: hypothetical protein [Cyanophyceae]